MPEYMPLHIDTRILKFACYMLLYIDTRTLNKFRVVTFHPWGRKKLNFPWKNLSGRNWFLPHKMEETTQCHMKFLNSLTSVRAFECPAPTLGHLMPMAAPPQGSATSFTLKQLGPIEWHMPPSHWNSWEPCREMPQSHWHN